MRPRLLLLVAGIVSVLASCSSVKKSTSTKIARKDSVATEKIDSGRVVTKDSGRVVTKDSSGVSSTEKTEKDRVIITLDPPDSSDTGEDRTITITPIDPMDYLEQDPGRPGPKGFKITVPKNTKSVEIITERREIARDSASVHTSDSSSFHGKDSAGARIDRKSDVSTETIDKQTSKNKCGATFGGILILVLIVGGYLFFKFRPGRKLFSPPELFNRHRDPPSG